MEDLISRQAAIDESFEIYVDGQKFEMVQVETLMGLPSAQPEIIRCKDCRWWTKLVDSIQGRCALMGAYPAGGWFCGNARRR